jgi:hypothetical protein
VLQWIWNDLRAGLPPALAVAARGAYHLGVVVGLVDSALHPKRHSK